MPQDALQVDLRQAIHSGQAVVIVGAGVSIGATKGHPCASWQGLLKNGVQRCVDVAQPLPTNWENRVTAEIDSGDLDDLLSAAEKITQKLGGKRGAEFSRWLRETVGSLHAEQCDVIDALHALHVPLLTTNYDNLLASGTDLQPVTWMDQAEVTRVLRRDAQGVLHLHGHWRRPESVILGIRSYEIVLGDQHAQTILRALQTMKTLIFVGCGEGLSDPNFGALLQWTAQVFATDEYRRFRLCRDAEVETLRQQHPPAQRLFPIPYGPNHDDLAAFLLSCVPPVLPPMVTSPPTPATTAALPTAPHCFGRDLQVEELVATLLTETPPPIAILGPPGIGFPIVMEKF